VKGIIDKVGVFIAAMEFWICVCEEGGGGAIFNILIYCIFPCGMWCTSFTRGRKMPVSSPVAFLRMKFYRTRYRLPGTISNYFFLFRAYSEDLES